jgi:hypothetical protein
VDDLRWGLVYWVHNYLAEQAGAAIYRLPQRWHPILRRCVGGRRGRRLLARKLSGFHRGGSPVITRHARRDSQRRGTTLEHVAHSDKWPTTARSIPADPRPSPSLSSAKIFTPPWLYPHQRAQITVMAQITAQRSPAARAAELVILLSHCTMVVTIRASDRPFCRARISNFHVITC